LSQRMRKHEARVELAAAVQKLPRQQRMLIELAYVEGKPVSEVARIMGVSPSRVSQVRTKALASLRAVFHAEPWFEVEHYQDLVA